MKIVCMIGTPPYLNYFINRIAEHHEIALVIRENSHAGILQKIKKKGIVTSIRLILRRFKNGGRFAQDYNNILGNHWQSANDKIPLVNVAAINGPIVRQQLEAIKPDLILVHGTSMIANKTLAGMPLALNLHWGLSPYYKGSYCTEWALLNHDPLNIGFTIHRISDKIDAGDVLTQGRVAVQADDTVNRINMKLTHDGTEAMIKVIKRLKNGERPLFQQQDRSKGSLYLVKHFTQEKANEVALLERPDALKEILKNPALEELPIIDCGLSASRYPPSKEE